MTPLPIPTVSICFGTLQRRPFLERALVSARRAVGRLSFEFVIVDGGSTDGTREFLQAQSDVNLILHGERRGAVAAFNEAFSKAKGEYVAALNDDLECIGKPLYSAVKLLSADETIGQIALPFLTYPVANASEIPVRVTGTPAIQTVPLPVLGSVPYANFSVMRRTLGDELGWWGDYYYTYAGDTELSTKVWAHGSRVVGLDPKDGYLIHYQARDDTRVPNVETNQYNKRWRGSDSPFYQLKHPEHFPKPEPSVAPLPSHHMKNPALLRFRGGQAGAMPFTPPNSSFNYSVSAGEPLVWVDGKDVPWMLSLQQAGGRVFERA